MSGHPRLPVLGVESSAFTPRPLPPDRPGRVESALRQLWSPSIRKRLHRPEHWLDWWTLARRYDRQELRDDELKPDFPIGRLPDCDACDDVCCTGPKRVVLLRLVDVAALVDAGLQDHMTLQKPIFPAAEVKASTPLQDLTGSEAWGALPVLKQDATQTCSLLTKDNQCGAWPYWPLSCARFPYSLDILRGRVFFAHSCQSRTQDTSKTGRAREKALMEALVDGYNQRLRDAVLLRVARPELLELGLGPYFRWP